MLSQVLQAGSITDTIGFFFLAIIVIVILSRTIRIVREYERAVIFRLGRLIGAKGPGLFIIIPFFDKLMVIDLRLLTLDVPKQNIITKDNISVDVDAVVYFRVADPVSAVVKVQDYIMASSLLAQTTLRDVIGQVEFDDILSKRDELSKRIQVILDEITEPWGIKVTSVAIRDASIAENMQRAIAKQAEAEREKRSRIIMAEGELQAAQKMAEAALEYSKDPAAMRLRELQTYTEIAREKNLIVVSEGSSQGLGTVLGLTRRKRNESQS